jgi:hypothetical protein
VPLAEAVAELLELSDLLDGQLRMRLAAFREGYELGGEAGYQAGYVDGILARKHAQHQLVEDLAVYLRRWDGRREDFGKPRPGDYPGRGGAAA